MAHCSLGFPLRNPEVLFALQQVGVVWEAEGPDFKWKCGLATAHPLNSLPAALLGRKRLRPLQHERLASILGT